MASTMNRADERPRRAHRWQPITDLGTKEWRELEDADLRALEGVWTETRDELDQTELERFNERLSREMAIETGVIERVYTLDRGTTQLLIEKGIDAALISRDATDRSPDYVAALIADQKEAVEEVFTFVKRNRQLSTSYVKELHATLLRRQTATEALDSFGRVVTVPLLRGTWKELPNNPQRSDGSIHENAPPEQVASEMDRLVRDHLEHDEAGVAAEVEAAWLHHRFTQVHPFQDGNGRVARCLASLIFIRAGWFLLTITRDDRAVYLDALEAAGGGDLAPLVTLFARRQRDAFRGALTAAEDIKRSAHVDHVIAAAREDIRRKRDDRRREWERAKETAASLETCAKSRFEDVQSKLTQELRDIDRRFHFHVGHEPPGGPRSHWFRPHIIDIARRLGYFADFGEHRAWMSLLLYTGDSRAEIILSVHGLGRGFRGLLAASCFFMRSEETEDGHREISDLASLTDEVFQINYQEDQGHARGRFERWLDEALVRGLEIWRRGYSQPQGPLQKHYGAPLAETGLRGPASSAAATPRSSSARRSAAPSGSRRSAATDATIPPANSSATTARLGRGPMGAKSSISSLTPTAPSTIAMVSSR